jgi:2-keto-3-deoxy-L-rhamnonate aldolase RhmA
MTDAAGKTRDLVKEIEKRRAELKAKLRARRKVFAAWTSLAHPSVTEMFVRSGVDFVGIDIEHSTISQEQSQRIIAASQAGNSLCLPRIASHNMEMIKRLLDSGADGLIVPMVNSLDDVRRLVSWQKYPPLGNRSFGISRGQGYGFDFDDYVGSWNRVSTLIVQIESTQGVANIGEILGAESVDGAMIGPYDLSGSMGIPGQIRHSRVVEASRKVIEACARAGKACGTQIIDPDERTLAEAFEQGFTFVVLASDIFILWKWAERMKAFIEPKDRP